MPADLILHTKRHICPNEKSLAFTATESEYLRRFKAFGTNIPRNEPLGAPEHRSTMLNSEN